TADGLCPIAERAGLTPPRCGSRGKIQAPWPRLYHNLRASCQTEWEARFPLTSVCQWIGNSPDVAARHYLTARDADFDAAVQGAREVALPVAQTGPGTTGNDRKSPDKAANRERAEAPAMPGIPDDSRSVRRDDADPTEENSG